MWNKRFLSLLALFALALLVVACAPQTGGEQPAATEEAGGGEAAAGAPAECAGENACVVVAPGDPVMLAFSGPMTGDNSNYGIDISQGAALAAEEADIAGHSVEIQAEDDGGTPEGGAQIANRVVAAGNIVAVVGPTFSGATQAAIPIYQEARIPVMSASATNPGLTTLGSDIFNRVAFSDLDQGEVAAGFIYNDLSCTTAAIIHDGTTYGQGLAEVARDSYVRLGGEVTTFEAITPGETDYSAVLTAISATPPCAIYFGGYAPEAAALVNGMEAAGLEDTYFASDDGTFGSTYIDLAGDNAEGTFATSAGVPAESEAKAAFDEKYLDTYGTAAGVLSGFTWFGYDAANVLIEAIKSVAIEGEDGSLYIPREALVTAVRSTSGYEGTTGTVTCDEVGECNATGPAIFVVEGGEFVAYQP